MNAKKELPPGDTPDSQENQKSKGGTRQIRVAASAHDFLVTTAKRRGVTVAGLVSEACLLLEDDRRAVRVAEALGRRFDEGRDALVEALSQSLGNLAGRQAALDADINILSAQVSELAKLVAFTAPEPLDSALANLAGNRRLSAMQREVVSGLTRSGGRIVSKVANEVSEQLGVAGEG